MSYIFIDNNIIIFIGGVTNNLYVIDNSHVYVCYFIDISYLEHLLVFY